MTIDTIARAGSQASTDTTPDHPYRHAAAHQLWRKAVADPGIGSDPAERFPFRIKPTDAVVAAGSCFAQNISRWLHQGGFNFLVTEPGHPILPKAISDSYHYGLYSARYGNIYTARQLVQLLRRAYGRFSPADDMWAGEDGRFIDPFRPQIQPGGFASQREFELDREQHFAAVRAAFETMDVFVFTLGLTEGWESAVDGAVYPACPGTAGGRFDPAVHIFRNHDVADIIGDLETFITELRAINSKVKIILTVSPVALVATATDCHVLVATTYSKSALRVAADVVVSRHADVAYFPSYEIITGPQSRGRYFADDLRSVTEQGVERVMTLFFRHATEGGTATSPALSDEAGKQDAFLAGSRAIVAALCDEERLDPGD